MSPVEATPSALEKAQSEVAEKNKALTGKGLRWRAGQTRGKNSSVITWQAFDAETPDSLPATLAEFVQLTGAKDAEVLEYVIDGFNSAAYGLASDELFEYVDDSWSKEIKNQFRLAVRNTVKLTGMDVEAVANAMKAGIAKKIAAASAA